MRIACKLLVVASRVANRWVRAARSRSASAATARQARSGGWPAEAPRAASSPSAAASEVSSLRIARTSASSASFRSLSRSTVELSTRRSSAHSAVRACSASVSGIPMSDHELRSDATAIACSSVLSSSMSGGVTMDCSASGARENGRTFESRAPIVW